MTNLSEIRTLSDNEWLSTATGVSGPLWVWRLFPVGVLVLACTMSLSDVDDDASTLEPFFVQITFSGHPYSSDSPSTICSFLFKQSTCVNSSPLVRPLHSGCINSLFKFNFPKRDRQSVESCQWKTRNKVHLLKIKNFKGNIRIIYISPEAEEKSNTHGLLLKKKKKCLMWF